MAAGQCLDCKMALNDPSIVRCAGCFQKRQDKRQSRIEQKICVRCSTPCEFNHIECNRCQLYKYENCVSVQQTRKAQGLCILCNEPFDNGSTTMCFDCIANRYAKQYNLTVFYAIINVKFVDDPNRMKEEDYV